MRLSSSALPVALGVLSIGCWGGPSREGFYECTWDEECPASWSCVDGYCYQQPGIGPAMCGDGICAPTESCVICEIDCGPCMTGCEPDPTGGSTRESATELAPEAFLTARLCAGEEDWYHVSGDNWVTVGIVFSHAMGDLDMQAISESDMSLGESTSSTDMETVAESAPFFVRVYGHAGAANSYDILRVD